jgi:hypothetical protein
MTPRQVERRLCELETRLGPWIRPKAPTWLAWCDRDELLSLERLTGELERFGNLDAADVGLAVQIATSATARSMAVPPQ